MLLTIIIPSFNQGRFLSRTLDSIISQDCQPVEVIVVDGASTDETLNILEQYAGRYRALRWISEPDNGPADAVNKGLSMARGEIAAIQSSDDVYLPGAFSAVIQAFRENPDCGFLIGHYHGLDVDGRVLYTAKMPEFSWEAYFGMALCIPQSSIFFRMSVARQTGGWNGSYFGCDLDYWLRILLRTRALRLDRVLSGWRIYRGARTHGGRRADVWDGYWRMIADNDLLRVQSPRIRRLARASRHILALRFHPTGNLWKVRWHVLLGFFQHPTFWRYHGGRELAQLVPGYGMGRGLFRWAKKLRTKISRPQIL